MYKFDFPIFKNNPKLVYLDSANTTQKPALVINGVNEYLSTKNANIHRGIYELSEHSTMLYERVRDSVASFINAQSNEIAFTSGATESINIIADSYFSHMLKEGDEIIITNMEHHANLLPWQALAKKTGAKLLYIDISEDMRIDIDVLKNMLTDRTKLISITHISHVLGVINPIESICKLAHKNGTLVLVDGAQAIGHKTIDVKQLDCDFYVFSGHKMLAPTGTGVIFAKSKLHQDFKPHHRGGGMIEAVSKYEATYQPYPHLLEAGTPNIVGVIGLGKAIDYLSNIAMPKIEELEIHLANMLLSSLLQEMPNVKCLNFTYKNGKVVSQNCDSGIVSFYSPKIHAHDLATFLNQDNIAVRAGHHCAMPLLNSLGIASTIRVSFALYNDENDVEKLILSLKKTFEYFE